MSIVPLGYYMEVFANVAHVHYLLQVGVPVHYFALSMSIGLLPYNFIAVNAGSILEQVRSVSILKDYLIEPRFVALRRSCPRTTPLWTSGYS